MIVDIEVPFEYYNYFLKFLPIFVNLNVSHSKYNCFITQNGHITKERKLVLVNKVKNVR